MELEKRRIGKIKIDDALLLAEPGLMSQAFAHIGFVTVKIEPDATNTAVIYTGYSKYFDAVAEGAEIPNYVFEFERLEDRTISIDLRR